jgi:hypothetical protein
MTGSLLQIASTSIKDIYLTIDPQITFFKIVYLRHTPFVIDILEETFNTIPNFGDEAFCELSKNGDLISNIFLKIDLPDVLISNIPDIDNISRYYDENVNYDYYYNNNNNTYTYNYISNASQNAIDCQIKINNFTTFLTASMVYWRYLQNLVKNITTNYTTINNYLKNLVNNQDDTQYIYNTYNTEFDYVRIKGNSYTFNFDIVNYILNNFNTTLYKESIYNSSLNIIYINAIQAYLSDYIIYQQNYLKKLNSDLEFFRTIINKEASQYYYFAWVSKIGFALIDYIDIEIGGQQIDRVTSEILNNWYELALNVEKKEMLDKMIGNIDILTNYDNNEKPLYTLLIPLPYWFCKYKSQALPCVGLKYNDILIKLKLNELYNCCYFEPDEKKEYYSNININEILQIKNISLLVEYIHVGEDERRKFGSFTNEILIEQHKILKFTNITSDDILLPLDYVNPVRELIWTIQKDSYINDLKLWNNFTTNDVFRAIINTKDNTGHIIISLYTEYFSSIIINLSEYKNGYVEIFHSKYYNGIYKILDIENVITTNQITKRIITEDTIIINNRNFIYYDNFKIRLYKVGIIDNYIINETIQIYGSDLISKRDPLYFTNVQSFQCHSNIPVNIHNYSFCLNPEIYQPSGSLNFSIIDTKNLYLEFDKDILKHNKANIDSYTVKIIARSHNLLRIENGMGKVLFGL